MTEGLLSIRQVAGRLSLNLATARTYSRRHKDFPTPANQPTGTQERLFRWVDVREWAVQRGIFDGVIDQPVPRRVLAADRITLDAITMPASEWQDRAVCRERPDVSFFSRIQASAAKELCAGCPVQRECLAVALSDPDTQGVWGGYSLPRERKAALASWA